MISAATRKHTMVGQNILRGGNERFWANVY